MDQHVNLKADHKNVSKLFQKLSFAQLYAKLSFTFHLWTRRQIPRPSRVRPTHFQIPTLRHPHLSRHRNPRPTFS